MFWVEILPEIWDGLGCSVLIRIDAFETVHGEFAGWQCGQWVRELWLCRNSFIRGIHLLLFFLGLFFLLGLLLLLFGWRLFLLRFLLLVASACCCWRW